MPYFVTESGLERLRNKETELKRAVQRAGAEAGDAAGMNCDWHDNAAYDEAKRTLELESRRFRELSQVIAEAVVVALDEQSNKVRIGSTVQVSIVDVDGEEQSREFTIGAYGETDPKVGLIAYTSPMASVLIAHSAGDTLEHVQIAGKEVEITINSIAPPSSKYIQVIRGFYEQS